VVIPAFGRNDLLERAVRSVLSQTMKPDEVIIVDDGSPLPLTLSISSATVPIRIIRLPHNRGIAEARNVGVDAARGDVVAFLDSDDAWLPWCLDAHARARGRDRKTTTFVHALSIADGRGIANGDPPVCVNVAEAVCQKTFVHCMSCFVVAKSAYQDIGGMRSQFEPCEDLDLFVRLFARCQASQIPCVLVHRSIDGTNVTANLRRWGQALMLVAKEVVATPSMKGLHGAMAHGVCRRLAERIVCTRMPLAHRYSLIGMFVKAIPTYLRCKGWRVTLRQMLGKGLAANGDIHVAHQHRSIVVSLDSSALDCSTVPFRSLLAERVGVTLGRLALPLTFMPLSVRPADDHRAALSICAAAAGLAGVMMHVPSRTQAHRLLGRASCLVTNNIHAERRARGLCPIVFLRDSDSGSLLSSDARHVMVAGKGVDGVATASGIAAELAAMLCEGQEH